MITGSPRNDVFFNHSQRLSNKDSDTLNTVKRVIYMPTLRGGIGSEFPCLIKSDFNYKEYDRMLERAGIYLEIKLHPVQVLSQIDSDQIKQCRNIKLVQCADIYEELPCFDALITDYSSIMFDFMLTGKPIYMAPFDIDLYLAMDRSMYYEYSEICPSLIYKNWKQLFEDLVHNVYDFSKYREVTRRFHVYKDGYSSKRAFDAIQNILP